MLDQVGRGAVDDVQEQVGFLELFEGGAESGDELRGQFLDEPDGVGEENGVILGESPASSGWVERLEETVASADFGVGQAVHQRRLAGVGVSDEGDQRNSGSVATLSVLLSMGADALEVLLESLDLIADQTTVGFELGFARTS